MALVRYRVGAILDVEDGTMRVLGYGRYDGEHVPDEKARGHFAEALRANKVPNPRLVLDNGDVVYGCECWWGTEDAIKARVAAWQGDGKTVTEVRIADMRARIARPGGP